MLGLSVDWDFWFREEPEWDLGHEETKLFQASAVWMTRAHLRQEYVPKPEYRKFWKQLEETGIRFGGKPLAVAGESHAYAYGWLAECGEIIHFDAHHDMGYNEKALDENHVAYCDDWLYKLAVANPLLKVRLVWPDWVPEYKESLLRASWLKPLKDRLTVTPWSAFQSLREKAVVRRLYIAHSGAWTPPWADEQFLEFCQVCPAKVTGYISASFHPRKWPKRWPV